MNILIVDDDASTREVLREILEEEGHVTKGVSSGEDALAVLGETPYPLVLSDIRMARMDGMRLLTTIKEKRIPSVMVLMTAFGSIDTAVEAIKNGAFDYVGKPFRIENLKEVVRRAVEHCETLVQGAAPRVHLQSEVPTKTLIGKSFEMVEIYKTVGRAALSTSNVLILGESGTGKELIARMIHENSERKTGKFVPVNCGAIAENLLESELFGHVKGSFTGAIANKQGLIEEANHGTLFLDEIGDMPFALQVKLLRALQEQEVRPVGSSESHKVDVRVIAATHRDLEAMIKSGDFREDLYYRLHVLSLRLPPLRERTEDLPELIQYFLARHSRLGKKSISHVSEKALALLLAYPWPGNIRELENAIERAVAMARTTILFPEDFPQEIVHYSPPVAVSSSVPDPASKSLEDIDKQHIQAVLKDVGFNKVEAAKVLGISRVTLYRKAKRYGLSMVKE